MIPNIFFWIHVFFCPALVLLPPDRRQKIRKVLPGLLRPYETSAAGDQSHCDSKYQRPRKQEKRWWQPGQRPPCSQKRSGVTNYDLSDELIVRQNFPRHLELVCTPIFSTAHSLWCLSLFSQRLCRDHDRRCERATVRSLICYQEGLQLLSAWSGPRGTLQLSRWSAQRRG